MNWIDNLLDRGNKAKQLAAPAAAAAPPVIKSVWVMTRLPLDAGDPGAAEPGFYSVTAGVLTMHDKDGTPTGQTHRLAAGDDERQIAGRLKRQAWSREVPAFGRPLHYQPLGLA